MLVNCKNMHNVCRSTRLLKDSIAAPSKPCSFAAYNSSATAPSTTSPWLTLVSLWSCHLSCEGFRFSILVWTMTAEWSQELNPHSLKQLRFPLPASNALRSAPKSLVTFGMLLTCSILLQIMQHSMHHPGYMLCNGVLPVQHA